MSSLTKNKKKQKKKNGGKKRGRGSSSSMFDAVQLLDSEDRSAEKKRHTTSDRDRQRSDAAKSQTKIYGSLMECRILLQRVIQQEQDMGSSSSASTVEQDDDDDDTALNSTNELLTKLLEARRTLLGDDQKNKKDYVKFLNDDDDADDRLNNILQSEYETCRDNWKEVLDRRYRDVRLHAGLTAKTQFRVLDSSFWQQIESTVQHEELQRQQNSAGDNNGDYDKLVFDDSKVYQQMLKEFVAANQAGGSGDHAAQRAAQLRLRKQQKSASSKNKPTVDRKASKGRKLRYQEIPKLVNFTFPISRPEAKSSNLDEDEWFRSLFGGVGRNSSQSS